MMKIYSPKAVASDNRSVYPEENVLSGSPYGWFDTAFFRNEHIGVTTFDFLVEWESIRIYPVIWVKRVYYSWLVKSDNNDVLFDSIINCDGMDFVKATYRFCIHNGLRFQYVLIPAWTEQEWIQHSSDINTPIIIFDVTNYKKGNTSQVVTKFSLSAFIEFLKEKRKAPAPMGSKGLYWSATALESLLSKPNQKLNYDGDAIYPGDADIVLFATNQEHRTLAIIEIKKHNRGSKRFAATIQDESIKLYDHRDIRKYQSLFSLKHALKTRFFMLFYPTTTEKCIKIQEADYDSRGGHAVVISERIFALPNRDRPGSLRHFQKDFTEYLRSGGKI